MFVMWRNTKKIFLRLAQFLQTAKFLQNVQKFSNFFHLQNINFQQLRNILQNSYNNNLEI